MNGLKIQAILPDHGEGTFRVELGPAEPDVGIFNRYLYEWWALDADGRTLPRQPNLTERDVAYLEEQALEAEDW